MEHNQEIYRSRRFSLIGTILKACFYSLFLISGFILGGLFINSDFKDYLKDTKIYKSALKIDYISSWANESTIQNKYVKKSSFTSKENNKILLAKNMKDEKKAFQIIDESNFSQNKETFFTNKEALKELEEAEKELKNLNQKARASFDISNPETLFRSSKEVLNNNTEIVEAKKEKNIGDASTEKNFLKNNAFLLEEKKEALPNKILEQKKEDKSPLEVSEKDLVEEESLAFSLTKPLKKEEATKLLLEENNKVENDNVKLDEKLKTKVLSKIRLVNLDPQTEKELLSEIEKVYAKYKFDPLFLVAIMMKESSINPDAISSKGKLGLLQLHPVNARKMADYGGIKLKSGVSLLDLAYNLEIGGSYLDFLNRVLKGNKEHILSAYYMGFENFINAAKNKTKLSQDVISYKADILNMYNKWSKKEEIKKASQNTEVLSATKNKSKIIDPFKTKKKVYKKTSRKPKKKLKLPKVQLIN